MIEKIKNRIKELKNEIDTKKITMGDIRTKYYEIEILKNLLKDEDNKTYIEIKNEGMTNSSLYLKDGKYDIKSMLDFRTTKSFIQTEIEECVKEQDEKRFIHFLNRLVNEIYSIYKVVESFNRKKL